MTLASTLASTLAAALTATNAMNAVSGYVKSAEDVAVRGRLP